MFGTFDSIVNGAKTGQLRGDHVDEVLKTLPGNEPDDCIALLWARTGARTVEPDEVLGEGAFGVVVSATHPTMPGPNFAVKMLKEVLMSRSLVVLVCL